MLTMWSASSPFVSIIIMCSLIIYFLGLGWHFLFPLVNVSSGELKPRGTFVAEHGISQGTVDSNFADADVRSPP